MAILVKYGSLKGESKIEGFTDHFEVIGFQHGVGRAIGDARGTSTREPSVASLSEITVTKNTDGVSVDLFTEALMGKLDKEVTIVFVRTGGDAPKKYLEYKLKGASISGFSVSSGGDRPTENISICYDEITMNYTPVGDDLSGSEGGFGWNLATAKKV